MKVFGEPPHWARRSVERIRRISRTQSSRSMIRSDWQTRFVYTLRDDVWLEDYVCGEPHRDLSSVAGVRRP